ncbi:MAG: hypothetical protein LBG88_04380 [Christensenellaceae bacterium]|jgi:ribonuclease BN (tRNA processing enzyme)|nr:hypothetical protein [Christensenellaceae bacterium]
MADKTNDITFLMAGAPMSGLGDTVAFKKAYNQGTNMLLLDFGSKIGKALEETDVLDDVDNVVAFGSHIHNDHVGGAKVLQTYCEKYGAKLQFLMPDIKRQRAQLLSALTALGIDKIRTTTADEAAAMMNLRRIEFEAMDHNRFDTEFKHFRVDTTALIMENQYGVKKVYAADNNDKKFIRSILKDKQLKELNLEMTFIRHGLGVHFTVNKADKVTEAENIQNKSVIRGMHFVSKEVSDEAKRRGYRSALDDIYTK